MEQCWRRECECWIIVEICIIDDDITSTRVLRIMCRRLSPFAEIRTFLEDKFAIEYYSKHEMPDLILCDYCVADVTGGEIMAWFRNRGFKGPAFYVTACVDDIPEQDRALVEAIIYKPCEKKDLARCLRLH